MIQNNEVRNGVYFTGSVEFYISINTVKIASASLLPLVFRYVVPWSVVAVVPSYGSTAGGTVVVVYGVSFESSVSASCVFGDSHSIAVLFTTNASTDTSPNTHNADTLLSKDTPYTTTTVPPAVLP